ncbi:hypothetical protein AX17_000677 [Amanita inopinata Kibby_2008]|nr:hypothetical protein AX17_000677 [Amanita inopinata Kibby_2008]
MLRRVILARTQYSEHFGLSRCPHLSASRQRLLQSHQPRCFANALTATQRARTCLSQEAVEVKSSQTQNYEHCPVKMVCPTVNRHVLSDFRLILSSHEEEERKLQRILASPSLSEYLANGDNVRALTESIACTLPPSHVLQALSLVQRLGHQLKQNVYECACFRLANLKQWRHVILIVSLGRRQTGRTSSRLLNWKARALLEMEQYGSLHNILGEFEQCKVKPNRRTYHLILTGHVRNHNLLQAKDCLQVMQEAGFSPDATTHALLAKNYRSLGADTHVQSRALESLRCLDDAKSVAVLNSLVQLRLDLCDVHGALCLLSYFTPPSVHAVIRTLTIHNDGQPVSMQIVPETSPASVAQSSERQLIPDASTFAIIINYMADQSNLTGALDVLRGMEITGIKPTSAVLISLVHAYTSASDIGTAVRLVASICSKRRSLLYKFVRTASETEDAELPANCAGMRPSVGLFNALLRGLIQMHGLGAVNVLLIVMRANNIRPNAATLEIFVTYLRKNENSRPGLVLRVLRQLLSSNLLPTSRHLHAILSCVFRHEKFLLYGSGWNATAIRLSSSRPAVEQPYPERRISSISDPFDPTAGLRLPRHLAYRSLARPIIDSLADRQIKSDAAMFALRIRHDAVIKSDLESADNTLQILLSRGLHPTKYHYSALLEGYALSGDMNRAEDLFKSMETAGLKPNVIMYTILIVGYGRQGKPEKALKVFQRMIAVGCKPDVPAIDALCGAYFASGAYAMARRVLISCWSYIQPFPEENRHLPLKELAIRFRSLHRGSRSVPESMTKQRRRMLHFRVRDLVEKWKLTSDPGRHIVHMRR